MKKLLIRAEDKNQWERRAPIVPGDVKKLIRETGAGIYVEKSHKRFFKTDEYRAAGARVCESMADGDVILGIKEIPLEKLLPEKTYAFFSHTIKGQKSGMPLLKELMRLGATLIDYEKITDADNRRLIAFGRYAGDAGVLDLLSLMGENWAHRGLKTPFALCRRAHEYSSVADARRHMKEIGRTIAREGLGFGQTSPFIVGILGYGNVASGARHILDCLPVHYIEPERLDAFVKKPDWNTNTVYVSVFREKDLVRRKADGLFDLGEYYKYPEKYESIFEAYLARITLLVNAVYWDRQYPRFVTWRAIERLYSMNGNSKLCAIADISCDTNGAIECNIKSTDTGMPAYRCDPAIHSIADGHLGEGIVILAVDNLPAELPNDASTYFSKQLMTFIPNILSMNSNAPLETSGLLPELQKAVIVYNGELTPDFEYLNEYLRN